MKRRRSRAFLAAAAMAILAACSSTEEGTLSLYTSVTQETVDAIIEAYTAESSGVTVEVFRAPTGELNARLAAERREGGIQADVLWLTDPLSIQQYDADGLLLDFTPDNAARVPAAYRSDRFWGTRIVSMVVVQRQGLEPTVRAWSDLTDPAYRDGVAVPDPSFAGSAFGAMGYLALAGGYGFDFYRALAANGAVQVPSPGEVVTGIAEGRFAAGMTLEFSARVERDKGAPIEIVWPQPGAIAVYSPIAVIAGSDNSAAAGGFVDYVLSRPGQEAIAGSGWQPVRDDVAWDIEGGPVVTPDWSALFNRQEELLDEYRSIFGG